MHQNERDFRVALELAFLREFSAYVKGNAIAELPDEYATFYEARDATLVRLERLNEQLIEKNFEQQNRREEEFAAKTRAREAELDALFQSRVAELESRAKQLNEREARMDLLTSTDARRKRYDSLKDELKKRFSGFSLTPQTRHSRYPTHVAFYVLLAATLILTAYYAWLTGQAPPAGIPAWFPFMRLSLAALGFAGSAVFFIRWQDRWAQLHADEEFRWRRFDIDVDRASWLVELLFEWQADQNREMPSDRKTWNRPVYGAGARFADYTPDGGCRCGAPRCAIGAQFETSVG